MDNVLGIFEGGFFGLVDFVLDAPLSLSLASILGIAIVTATLMA